MTHLEDTIVIAQFLNNYISGRLFDFVCFYLYFFYFPPFQVRVAKSNYTFPKLVAGHFVIFDDDLACLIVFNLYKVGLFHRVKMSAS